MNILLTNDDGYDSKGIRTLFKLLSKYGTVVIVAPDSPRSANSAALTLGKPIQLEQVEDRINRITNTKPAFIYRLICEGTIDEVVADIIDMKQAISDYMVDDKADAHVINILKN